MLDKQKVRLMTKLAFYEHTQGKEDFKINEYYRKDYTGIHTICSVLWVTVGYACLAGLVLMTGMDHILENLSQGMIITMGAAAVIAYFVLIIVYAIVANRVFDKKHRAARQRMKIFNHNLTRLLKMYEKERR